MTDPIRYTLTPHHPEAHLFRVACTVPDPDPQGQVFSLPAWIPGSYMIREFARNIVSLRAESGGRAVEVEKLDKHTWRAAPVPAGAALTVECEVYAWDLSVRSAHLDATHGFFNGTSVFLAPQGRTDRPCQVDIRPPEGSAYKKWRVATSLPRALGSAGCAWPLGFGLYRAADYDELVDHPVEMGSFTHFEFAAGGVDHEFAITGRHDCDVERLSADLARVCAWHLELFGSPAPVERYVFLATVVDDGYGGLEHRDSTALLANRADLPYPGMKSPTEGYRSFLGLCSHEYFHTWNVKRIKPAAFIPYDYGRENYTPLLWAFEGFTSYYDDLALVRSGVIALEDYLALVAKTATQVLRGSGRLRQSVAESSFDAWTKYYRQDENAPNAIVSYYAKGALIALGLDLQLRAGSDGVASLDDVMRLLWRRHGCTGLGVDEDDLYEYVAEVGGTRSTQAGRKLAGWLRRMVHGTEDVPLARLLKSFAVDFRLEPENAWPSLGVKFSAGGGKAKVAQVHDGGPAQAAGLSAGDTLVAIDGLRLSAANLDTHLRRRGAGERVEIHAFRRDELMRFDVVLAPAPGIARLTLAAKPTVTGAALRKGWLGA